MASIFFSDFFGVGPADLENYGAVDISLVGDLPLFVDPFLLFNSTKPEYQKLHREIIRYMRFLRDVTQANRPLVRAWFAFPEVRQNWLGFSQDGNCGHGLGQGFASALQRNFTSVFRDFGDEKTTQSSHIEKLGLLRDGVGRDMISDFTVNLIIAFLADYTQEFARSHINLARVKKVTLPRVAFNYDTMSWAVRDFELPCFAGDYVLLTPKDILTRDDTWINREELKTRFISIVQALPDAALREQVNAYLAKVLPHSRQPTKNEERMAIEKAINVFPQVVDYYIQEKEASGSRATTISRERVREVETSIVECARELVRDLFEPLGFYQMPFSTLEESRRRIAFFKDVIENKGGHRLFLSLKRESDLQILFRFVWFATAADVNREVNDGRGPVDYSVSKGSGDKTHIEFKLASNPNLRRNLERQCEVYAKASDTTHPAQKVILFYSNDEHEKVKQILAQLSLMGNPNIVLIDARPDNKPSGSKA